MPKILIERQSARPRAKGARQNKMMLFTSIFCGFSFCGSAVHILEALIVGSCNLIVNRKDSTTGLVKPLRVGLEPSPLIAQRVSNLP